MKILRHGLRVVSWVGMGLAGAYLIWFTHEAHGWRMWEQSPVEYHTSMAAAAILWLAGGYALYGSRPSLRRSAGGLGLLAGFGCAMQAAAAHEMIARELPYVRWEGGNGPPPELVQDMNGAVIAAIVCLVCGVLAVIWAWTEPASAELLPPGDPAGAAPRWPEGRLSARQRLHYRVAALLPVVATLTVEWQLPRWLAGFAEENWQGRLYSGLGLLGGLLSLLCLWLPWRRVKLFGAGALAMFLVGMAMNWTMKLTERLGHDIIGSNEWFGIALGEANPGWYKVFALATIAWCLVAAVLALRLGGDSAAATNAAIPDDSAGGRVLAPGEPLPRRDFSGDSEA